MKTPTSTLPWYEVGTKVMARYYGTRTGIIVKETPTRVWIQIVMPGRQASLRYNPSRTIVKAYRKADQMCSQRACVQLGTWAVLDVEVEARYAASNTATKPQFCCECRRTTTDYTTIDVGSYGDGTRRRYHVCAECQPTSKLVA